jgi:PBP1b-binding outer membrane lipoprotein LpoB
MSKTLFLINSMLCFFIFFVLSGCSGEEKSVKKTTPEKNDFIEEINIDSLSNGSFSKLFNKSKSYVVYFSDVQTNNSTKFYIANIKTGEIIFTDKVINCELNWISDSELAVIEQPGMIKKDDDKVKPKYIYNVITKNKS